MSKSNFEYFEDHYSLFWKYETEHFVTPPIGSKTQFEPFISMKFYWTYELRLK